MRKEARDGGGLDGIVRKAVGGGKRAHGSSGGDGVHPGAVRVSSGRMTSGCGGGGGGGRSGLSGSGSGLGDGDGV